MASSSHITGSELGSIDERRWNTITGHYGVDPISNSNYVQVFARFTAKKRQFHQLKSSTELFKKFSEIVQSFNSGASIDSIITKINGEDVFLYNYSRDAPFPETNFLKHYQLIDFDRDIMLFNIHYTTPVIPLLYNEWIDEFLADMDNYTFE